MDVDLWIETWCSHPSRAIQHTMPTTSGAAKMAVFQTYLSDMICMPASWKANTNRTLAAISKKQPRKSIRRNGRRSTGGSCFSFGHARTNNTRGPMAIGALIQNIHLLQN